MALFFTGIFYYLGFLLLGRIKAFPIFKVILLASVLVIIAILLLSLKWKISAHMAALGSLTGVVFAIAFRTGINPFIPILVLILASGLTGTSRLMLEKNNLPQIATGYILGFLIVYLTIFFV